MYDIYRDMSKTPMDSAATVEEAARKIDEIAESLGHGVVLIEIDDVEDGVDAILENGIILSTRKRVTE